MSSSADLELAKDAYISAYLNEHVYPSLLEPTEGPSATKFFKAASFGEHHIRFIETYDRIVRHVNLDGKSIAETGHKSGISEYLIDKGYKIAEFGGDFRYQLNAPDDAVDILFTFEVMEHIKDQDSSNFDDIVLFNFSGIRKFISEMHRVVKPGGLVVATTPNACSLRNIVQLCEGEMPMLFSPHVREYAPKALIEFFAQAGFSCEFHETFYACFYLCQRDHYLRTHFESAGYSPDGRGDIGFYIFRKS